MAQVNSVVLYYKTEKCDTIAPVHIVQSRLCLSDNA